MGPSPRPLFVQMGLTRAQAAAEVRKAKLSRDETFDLILLLGELPEPGDSVPRILTYAEPGEAVIFLQRHAAKSGKATTWTSELLHVAHHSIGTEGQTLSGSTKVLNLEGMICCFGFSMHKLA